MDPIFEKVLNLGLAGVAMAMLFLICRQLMATIDKLGTSIDQLKIAFELAKCRYDGECQYKIIPPFRKPQ